MAQGPGQLWRSFKFFEMEPIKGPLESLEITASCSGRSSLVFGDAEGMIRAYDRTAKTLLYEYQAFNGPVTHLKALRTRNMLISIGDDDAENVAVIRMWDLDRRDVNNRPQCKEHRIFSPKYPAPPRSSFMPLRINYNPNLGRNLKFRGNATAGAAAAATPGTVSEVADRAAIFAGDCTTCVISFDISEDMQHMAIAVTSNEVVLLRGDLERDRSPKIRRIRGTLAREKLTFVGFPRTKEQETRQGAGRYLAGASFVTLLYTVYEDVVVVWRITQKGDALESSFDPPTGAKYECSCIDEEGELVVASWDSPQISFYGGEQFMADMALRWDPDNLHPKHFCEIEGEKRKIAFHKQYIIALVCQDPDKRPERFLLGFFDPDARIKALSPSQSTLVNCGWILSDVGEVIVFSQDLKSDYVNQRVVRFSELDTQAKLDQLFKKDLYDEAKKMAKRLQINDTAQQIDIQRKYGDNLYEKGKFDQAIEQYIEAIGYLEPSYVIRKFLDAQRINNLTRYLEELHHERHRIANKNHTTLLLNCYTKLKNEKKLNDFIRRDDIRFDAHNAIKVCRQAGYYDAATYLAQRYHQPSDYVKIQMENLGDHLKALRFIQKLPLDEAEAILREHGKELLSRCPVETTETLIELCSEWKGPRRSGGADAAKPRNQAGNVLGMMSSAELPDRSFPGDFIPAFVDSPLCLMKFLESVVKNSFQTTSSSDGYTDEETVYNTLLELYLTPSLQKSVKHVDPEIFSAVASSGGRREDSSLHNSKGGNITGGGRDEAKVERPADLWEVPAYEKRLECAMAILEDHVGKYDPAHALVLVQQHRYEKGILFMLESMRLYSEIFAHHAKQFESGETPKIRESAKMQLLQLCETWQQKGRGQGTSVVEEEREMWISLLSLLVRSKDDVAEDITRVLARIEQEDLLPAVAVVEILSTNKSLQLKTVRDYVLRMLMRDTEKIEKYNSEIAEMSEKTRKQKEEIRELQTCATVFQSNRCTACSTMLDLPAIHFMCKHSYHQRCLNDPRECNICAAEARKLLQMQREFEEKKDDHDEFFKRVATSQDGFTAVADALGRGIFAMPKLKKLQVAGTWDPEEPDQPFAAAEEDLDDVDGFGDDIEVEDPEDLENW